MPVHATGSLLAGRYRVLRPLGSGGMATVVLCADERLGREVAVKRLHAYSPDDGARRFAREAKVGASLNHPNLVTVFDTVSDGEAVLIVMEHVPGGTLRDVLRDGPLGSRAAARVMRDVAAGLDHAHAHGVVHRDVKPANVLLRDDGVAKLVDLGIAVAADQTRITQSGTVLGTAAYMAPEQLEGGATGPATDVYALAAVAFEALSGRRARSGRTAVEIAHQVANDGPPDIRALRPELPAAVGELLQHGMAQDPSRRPRSAGELARELERALEDGDSPTAPTRAAPARSVGSAAAGVPPAPPRRILPADPSRRRGAAPPRRSWLAPALLGLAALAVAAVLVVVLGSGGDNGDSGGGSRAAGGAGETQADGRASGGGGAAQPEQAQPEAEQPAVEQPEAEQPKTKPAKRDKPHKPAKSGSGGASGYAVPGPSGSDPTGAAQLNDRGFALMGEGRYDEAIPQLEQAVRAANAGDATYAYALFNLGSSLRQAGRPEDAIPVLERRLEIPDQTETVQAELDAARRDAGG